MDHFALLALTSVLFIVNPIAVILRVVAMGMLHGERRTQESATEISEGSAKSDVALTPLAMPMLAGPGAISTVMVLSGQAGSTTERLAVYLAVVVTMALSWIALRLGERVVVRLGETGIRVDAHHGPAAGVRRRAVRDDGWQERLARGFVASLTSWLPARPPRARSAFFTSFRATRRWSAASSVWCKPCLSDWLGADTTCPCSRSMSRASGTSTRGPARDCRRETG